MLWRCGIANKFAPTDWRLIGILAGFGAAVCAQTPLPNTQPLTSTGDLSAEMVAGISRYLDAELKNSVARREEFWRPDFSTRGAYDKSIAPNRARLAKMIGAVDARVPQPELEYIGTPSASADVAGTERFIAHAVRWPVFDGVYGEGMLLQPKGEVVARVVVLPDSDQTPETICGLVPKTPVGMWYARRLAENGCQVIVPALIDRSDAFSGNPRLGRATNQPHREWIYRQAYELGRHVIGYEVQKVMAAVDWFARQNSAAKRPIGVAGWGEGGLIAFYAAALDPRIDVACISGYFGRRELVWQEPIYRNVFGLLREFGDAEIARLIVPRKLIIDPADAPVIAGPPAPRPRIAGAAPGRIVTPEIGEVRSEVERAQRLARSYGNAIQLMTNQESTGGIGEAALLQFVGALGQKRPSLDRPGTGAREGMGIAHFSAAGRQERQVRELERFTQRQLQLSAAVRDEFFWKKVPPATLASPDAWREAMRPYREKFWNDVIGRVPASTLPLNPRSRPILDRPTWTAHEVVLDVAPDVFAWGYLLLPKGMKAGEKRPVVVVQHGLEGVPADVINEDESSRAWRPYKAFGARLVERGFIVFAPHNPYRGEDTFRMLQRKANPLGLSLFSFIIAQHERILDWLGTLPNVDAARIGFYGLSYGGKTAMRVPAVLERYVLSICSGDFNEWVYKNATTEWPGSYMFTKEWEMFEFDLGSTFNYAEMAALIAPRPFMVERGHDDGVGIDEWVAFEYAKVNRLYAKLKIPERTEIEYFNGPHTIHGVGTYKFLHRHLNWPEPR
jgi:dienelactone hydrolase